MAASSQFDTWSAGESYNQYMGRWSRVVARKFLDWLAPPRNADWLDVGCGTGALTGAALASSAPKSMLSVDPSEDFLAHARSAIPDPRVTFRAGDAQNLPVASCSVDLVVSALVLNFVADPQAALREMRRVLRPSGVLSFYVWDYPGGGVGFIDAFWKAAIEIDPKAAALDESGRFSNCTRDGLLALCEAAGLENATVDSIQAATEFASFDDFWRPFTLGAGPAPGYCKTLSENQRDALRERLALRLGTAAPIVLPARAWAMKAALTK